MSHAPRKNSTPDGNRAIAALAVRADGIAPRLCRAGTRFCLALAPPAEQALRRRSLQLGMSTQGCYGVHIKTG